MTTHIYAYGLAALLIGSMKTCPMDAPGNQVAKKEQTQDERLAEFTNFVVGSHNKPAIKKLFLAAFIGDKSLAEEALAEDASVNSMLNPIGTTAIYWAAHEGHAPIVQLLLERGALYHAATLGQRNPWDVALKMKHDEVIRVMGLKGATP